MIISFPFKLDSLEFSPLIGFQQKIMNIKTIITFIYAGVLTPT